MLCLKLSRATSSYLSLIYIFKFLTCESHCSPSLEDCSSELYENICEGVLKVMFMCVSMLSNKMLLNSMLLISMTILQLKLHQDATKLFR